MKMKITKKQRKAKLRADRVAKGFHQREKGSLIEMSDGTQYHGRTPRFEVFANGYIRKTQQGVPFRRVWPA